MQEWIRQIIIYVILVTVLRGLIMKPQYEQYFRFFSGMVLILLGVKSSSQLRRAGDRRLLCSNIRSS